MKVYSEVPVGRSARAAGKITQHTAKCTPQCNKGQQIANHKVS
jgi:hypothetical protein